MITADNSSLPLKITRTAVRKADGTTDLTLTVEATEKCRFNIAETSVMNGTRHEACEFICLDSGITTILGRQRMPRHSAHPIAGSCVKTV